KEGRHQHSQPQYQRLTKLELRMVVQELGGATQSIVDHELDTSQHTGEEKSHEVEDRCRLHGAVFLSARLPTWVRKNPSSRCRYTISFGSRPKRSPSPGPISDAFTISCWSWARKRSISLSENPRFMVCSKCSTTETSVFEISLPSSVR